MKKNKFVVAFRGINLGLMDSSIRIQWLFLAAALFVCYIIRVEVIDYLLVGVISAMVIALEYMNTAFERIMDYMNPSYDERIRNIKDLSAASVLIMSFGAILVAAYIGIKYFM